MLFARVWVASLLSFLVLAPTAAVGGIVPAADLATQLDASLLGPELVPGGDFETATWSSDVGHWEGYWRTGLTPVDWTGHHIVFDPVGGHANRGGAYSA